MSGVEEQHTDDDVRRHELEELVLRYIRCNMASPIKMKHQNNFRDES
jgi:hypothetical protein